MRRRRKTKILATWGRPPTRRRRCASCSRRAKRASQIARQEGFAEAGERIVITAGVPLGTTGATNMLRVAFVDDYK